MDIHSREEENQKMGDIQPLSNEEAKIRLLTIVGLYHNFKWVDTSVAMKLFGEYLVLTFTRDIPNVRLENGERVYYTEENAKERATNPKNTTLTTFLQLCQNDPFAKTLLYHEVPRYYTWNAKKSEFCRRKQGKRVPEYAGIGASNTLGQVC